MVDTFASAKPGDDVSDDDDADADAAPRIQFHNIATAIGACGSYSRLVMVRKLQESARHPHRPAMHGTDL